MFLWEYWLFLNALLAAVSCDVSARLPLPAPWQHHCVRCAGLAGGWDGMGLTLHTLAPPRPAPNRVLEGFQRGGGKFLPGLSGASNIAEQNPSPNAAPSAGSPSNSRVTCVTSVGWNEH